MFQLKSKILQAELFFTWKVKLYCGGPERIRAVGTAEKERKDVLVQKKMFQWCQFWMTSCQSRM